MQIAETGFIPQAWEQAQIIMIPKLGKADYTAASAYRLIALLLTLSNIYKKLLTKHLSEPVKQKHMLHGGHYGGGPNKSGHDALKMNGPRETLYVPCLLMQIGLPLSTPPEAADHTQKEGIP